MDWTAVMRVLAALEGGQVDYAVVGGIAVNLHGLARGTRDIDLFLAPTAENIERLKTALRSVYDDASIDEILASDLLGDYQAVAYAPPNGPSIEFRTRLPAPLDPKDPATWATIRDLWGFIARALPPLYPPGVRRFRTMEELNHARDEATIESARALHRSREAAKR